MPLLYSHNEQEVNRRTSQNDVKANMSLLPVPPRLLYSAHFDTSLRFAMIVLVTSGHHEVSKLLLLLLLRSCERTLKIATTASKSWFGFPQYVSRQPADIADGRHALTEISAVDFEQSRSELASCYQVITNKLFFYQLLWLVQLSVKTERRPTNCISASHDLQSIKRTTRWIKTTACISLEGCLFRICRLKSAE